MFNTGKFAQKTVVISGASRGIGKQIALKLARDGANIVVCAKTKVAHPKLPGTIYTAAEEIVKAGGRALPCVVDVRDEQSVQNAIESAMNEFGGIDILINNASAISLTGTLDTPMKRYDLMHSVNTRGTFLMSQKCIPYLKQAKNPHILNLSPPLLMEAQWFQHHVAYTIAKYGMSMCVLGMSEELRPFGIAVNAIWPKTAIWTAAMDMLTAGTGEAGCRKTDIIADAAYAMLSKNSREYTGNFAIDEDVLRHEGLTDFDQYACVKGVSLMPDFFVPGISYEAAVGAAKDDSRDMSRDAIKSFDLNSLAEEIVKSLPSEMAKKIGAVYDFSLIDGSSKRELCIDLKSDPPAVNLKTSTSGSDVQFEMTLEDFGRMLRGEFSSSQAFMQKKMQIRGNMAKAIQLESLLKNSIKTKSKL